MSEQVPHEHTPLDSWEKARQYVRGMGDISSVFSSAIRDIKTAEDVAVNKQERKVAQALTLEKAKFLTSVSDSLKTIFYFAAKALHPERLRECVPLTTERLLALFSPTEVANIIALAYLYRNIGRGFDAQEWKVLGERMNTHMEIGAIVGSTIENIDVANGFLLGGMRYLCFAMFAKEDLKKFQEHRRAVEHRGGLFDLKQEEKKWGCHHMQIASVIAQSIGLGTDVAMGLGGLDILDKKLLGDEADPALDLAKQRMNQLRDRLACWREAISWTESFHKTGEPPVESSVDDDVNKMSVSSDIVTDIRDRVAKVRADGPSYDWIQKKISDLPPEVVSRLNIRLDAHKDVAEMKAK